MRYDTQGHKLKAHDSSDLNFTGGSRKVMKLQLLGNPPPIPNYFPGNNWPPESIIRFVYTLKKSTGSVCKPAYSCMKCTQGTKYG